MVYQVISRIDVLLADAVMYDLLCMVLHALSDR